MVFLALLSPPPPTFPRLEGARPAVFFMFPEEQVQVWSRLLPSTFLSKPWRVMISPPQRFSLTVWQLLNHTLLVQTDFFFPSLYPFFPWEILQVNSIYIEFLLNLPSGEPISISTLKVWEASSWLYFFPRLSQIFTCYGNFKSFLKTASRLGDQYWL